MSLLSVKLVIGRGNVPQKKKDQPKTEEPKPYGAFTGLSEALPEFYGQAALAMGNPAIGENVSWNNRGPGGSRPIPGTSPGH